MPLRDNISNAIHGHNELAYALAQIARGRADCGRPIAAETARQMARDTLIRLGMDWGQVLKVHAEMQPLIDAANQRRGT